MEEVDDSGAATSAEDALSTHLRTTIIIKAGDTEILAIEGINKASEDLLTSDKEGFSVEAIRIIAEAEDSMQPVAAIQEEETREVSIRTITTVEAEMPTIFRDELPII